MKYLNKKQSQLVNKFDEIMQAEMNESYWLDIAYSCTSSDMDEINVKLEKILDVVKTEHKKLHDRLNALWCDLRELI